MFEWCVGVEHDNTKQNITLTCPTSDDVVVWLSMTEEVRIDQPNDGWSNYGFIILRHNYVTFSENKHSILGVSSSKFATSSPTARGNEADSPCPATAMEQTQKHIGSKSVGHGIQPSLLSWFAATSSWRPQEGERCRIRSSPYASWRGGSQV